MGMCTRVMLCPMTMTLLLIYNDTSTDCDTATEDDGMEGIWRTSSCMALKDYTALRVVEAGRLSKNRNAWRLGNIYDDTSTNNDIATDGSMSANNVTATHNTDS